MAYGHHRPYHYDDYPTPRGRDGKPFWKRFSFWLKAGLWCLAAGLVAGAAGAVFLWITVSNWAAEDLADKDETVIVNYQPAVMTRVHAGDGALIAEYSRESRLFVPIENMPPRVVHAFIAAEDQHFRAHNGVDYPGVFKAQVRNVLNCFRGGCTRHGGSSITQQVAKNFFLTRDQTIRRKAVEIVLAHRIEAFRTKDDILELYLNEIFLGRRAHGVAAAALLYFGKPLDELSLSQTAYLAALPKAPSTLDITRESARPRAEARRNYVLGRMVDDGYITPEDAAAAREEKLVPVERKTDPRFRAAGFFVEQVRREMLAVLRLEAGGIRNLELFSDQNQLTPDELYAMLDEELFEENPLGRAALEAFATQEEKLDWMILEAYARRVFYDEGLSIRTTLDTTLQAHARDALRWGLETYDRRHGYRGPIAQLTIGEDWAAALGEITPPGSVDYDEWSMAVVLEVASDGVIVGLPDGDAGQIPLYADLDPQTTDIDRDADGDGVVEDPLSIEDTPLNWAREFLPPDPNEPGAPSTVGPPVTSAGDALNVGDVVLVELLDAETRVFALRQEPQVNGAIMAMDPHTGRVLAMVGGYYFRFGDSELNRTRQAVRQPGSSFKPFVYAAAFEQGYTPADVENGGPYAAPIENEPGKWWTPQEYLGGLGSFRGEMTLRRALELSKNTVSIRVAEAISLENMAELAERMGAYESLRPYPANALGAQETTVWRLVTAYSVFVNGGKRIEPTILDRVQDRTGNTVYVHDPRATFCDRRCQVRDWAAAHPPSLPDDREQLITDATAYQVVSVLEGVVQRGTATRLKSLGRPVAGKTGTTNNFVDAWFVGFSPDLVVGVFVGFDEPRSMGGGESGGRVAAPIFEQFMADALETYPNIAFRTPDSVALVRIDGESGLLAPRRTDGGPIDAPYTVNGCPVRPLIEAFKIGTAPTTRACDAGGRQSAGDVIYGEETIVEQPLSALERARLMRQQQLGEDPEVAPQVVVNTGDDEDVGGVY